MLLDGIFYYLLYSSAVLIYGIGLNRAAVLCTEFSGLFLTFFKSLITVVCTVLLGRLVVWLLLEPVGMAVMYPFFCVLIQVVISAFCQVLVGITAKTSAAEFSVSFLCIILALNESVSVGESVLFVLCCVCSFYLFIPLLVFIEKRLEHAKPLYSFSTGALIFLSIAVIVLALSSFNVSWLSHGVLK